MTLVMVDQVKVQMIEERLVAIITDSEASRYCNPSYRPSPSGGVWGVVMLTMMMSPAFSLSIVGKEGTSCLLLLRSLPVRVCGL
jgi:hypothetical protein